MIDIVTSIWPVNIQVFLVMYLQKRKFSSMVIEENLLKDFRYYFMAMSELSAKKNKLGNL